MNHESERPAPRRSNASPSRLVHRRLALLLAALLATPAGTAAAVQGGSAARDSAVRSPAGLDLRPPRLVKARPFDWSDDLRGVVDVPLGAEGGWNFWPPVLQWRFVTPVTSDPIVEVVVYAPYSGHPTLNERFKLQVPVGVPPHQRGLLVAYHGFSASENQIFTKTSFPSECTAKGWLLLAPQGLHDLNFGNVQSQKANEAALALVATFFPFDFGRLYTFGFSMGALNAASFAFRHQDPGQIRVAGVAYHTGTTDIVRDYEEATAPLKVIFEHPEVFGGSPAAEPFAYARVNPMRYLPSLAGFDPDQASVHSLLHTPIYLYLNPNDPLKYDEWTQDLQVDLSSNGGDLTFVSDAGAPAVHEIGTIDEADVLAWADAHPLGPLPTSAKLFGDRPGKWLWTRLVSDPGGTVARWTVDVTAASNSFDVDDTHAVGTLAFDLALMGLDPTQPLAFTAESGDGTADVYVLEGYVTPPSSVLVDGGPPLSWSHDAVSAELTVQPNATGAQATIQIVP